MVADYNCADFALAADEQTYLPVDVAGKKRYLFCKIISNDMRGAQPRRISGNFVDGRLPLIS
jgi:hypothetical protein